MYFRLSLEKMFVKVRKVSKVSVSLSPHQMRNSSHQFQYSEPIVKFKSKLMLDHKLKHIQGLKVRVVKSEV